MTTAAMKNHLKLTRLEARDCPTAGALDLTFAGTGIATPDFNGTNAVARFVAIQPDQKIVVAGIAYPSQQHGKNQPTSNDIGLMRLNLNGSLDATFGAGGKVRTDIQNKSSDVVFDGAIQPNGKIVIAGTSDGKFAVARYNANGSLDASFHSDGKVTTTIAGNSLGSVGMLLQPDGKIVVGSKWRSPSGAGGFVLVRYNSTGSLDNTFDGDGISTFVLTSSTAANNNLRSLALQSDGRILAAGTTGELVATLARYNANGSLDTSFGGGDGHVELVDGEGISDVILQSDRILVAGSRSPTSSDPVRRPLIGRFDSAGALDPSFGSNGLVIELSLPSSSFYGAVEIQADGKIVAAGATLVANGVSTTPNAFLVGRYSADGVLDTSFDGDGTVVTDASPTRDLGPADDMAIQTDGKIVVAGYASDASGLNTSFAVVRYLGDDMLRAPTATSAFIIASTLEVAQAQPLLAEAISRWPSAGFAVPLKDINFRIADLGGSTLGRAFGNTIWLDDNAAGHGWFVDPTPRNDSEFTTPGDQGEQNRIDLLTVLSHEVGHLIGLDHADGGVMQETLGVGERFTPHGVHVGGTDFELAQPSERDLASGRRMSGRLRR